MSRGRRHRDAEHPAGHGVARLRVATHKARENFLDALEILRRKIQPPSSLGSKLEVSAVRHGFVKSAAEGKRRPVLHLARRHDRYHVVS